MPVNPDHEVLIIGAGVCGIYQLYRLRELGIEATVLEAGDGPGGTWYWNRYPGARFDSESYTYGYSFSKELLDEWDWSERFSAQPETLRYLEHVVEKFDLRRDMQFGCKVVRSEWDEAERLWTVNLADGRSLTCRWLMTAIGLLSAPTEPNIPGTETFAGQAWHTYRWPKEPVELAGKRVAIIGTGATGVQLIPVVAEAGADLTVFQRRPNWCAPLHNGPLSTEEMAEIRSNYDAIFEKCAQTPGGFLHEPDRRPFLSLTAEERREKWEDLYAQPGFGIWLSNFLEIFVDEEANAELSAFIAEKIRDRVDDPEIAEKLIPTDHGFGTQRVPMETRYYEAYNRDNVTLVDVSETPIVEIEAAGIRTSAELYEFDIIIYATGFDAVVGSFDRMEFVGTDGQTLRDKWSQGPVTYLGIGAQGFPNLITLAGPTAGSVSTNFPRGIETGVEWATDLMKHLRDEGLTRIEALPEREVEWTEHVASLYERLLMRHTKAWFNGYNSNVEGRDTARHLIYNGGNPKYRKLIDAEAEAGYPGFVLA